ncbi:MAG: aldehyde dehydrogenase family protein, partial [Acidimicrobiia bacterium]|nr:aldehyde dehydrogenase family protein [Acidimicrobiia bacterium]
MRTITHWIDGAADAGRGSERAPVFEPASGHQQAEVVLGTTADVDAAVASARAAFPGWRDTSLAQRVQVLFRYRALLDAHRDELAEMISSEHGKVRADALGEVGRGLEVVELACGIPELLKGEHNQDVSGGIDAFNVRQPLGVAAGISPFNFPAMVPMWLYPVAVACGNCFVLKPSEKDPSVSVRLAQLFTEAGLPAGVFNVVQGDATAVNALLEHPDIAAVSFVGSTPIARHVHQSASTSGKRVQALGGAKNHMVVLP